MALAREPNSVFVAPPINGWNTESSIVLMDPTYALTMDNFFPDQGVVSLRRGSDIHATGVGTGISQTIMTLNYVGVSKMIAHSESNGLVYDITAAGAATEISPGTTSIGTGGYGVKWVQFRDRIILKGPDTGTDVYHWTGSGDLVASAFTGPGGDDKNIIAVGAYKSRVYFGQATSPSLWYGAVDAVTGALTEFPLTSIFTYGDPTIIFCGGTSRTKEYAEDSLFVIISVSGEMLVYQGDYPGSSTWALVGKYPLPSLLGPGSIFYYGSDLLIATKRGIISTKQILSGGFSSGQIPTISENIDSYFINSETASLGFQGVTHYAGNKLILNFYDSSLQEFVQVVRNLHTGAWCRFKGWNARSVAVFNDDFYYSAGDGVIMKADVGDSDENPTSAGNVVTRSFSMRSAFNYLGNPRSRKRVVGVRPIHQQNGGLSSTIYLGVDVDYANVTATTVIADADAGVSDAQYKPFIDIGAEGKALSVRVDGTATNKELVLQAFEVFWEDGSSL